MSELLGPNRRPTQSEERSLTANLISRLELAAAVVDSPLGWTSPNDFTSYSAEPSRLTEVEISELVLYGLAHNLPVDTLAVPNRPSRVWTLTQFAVSLATKEIVLNDYLIMPEAIVTASARGPVIDLEADTEIDPIYDDLIEAMKHPQPATWDDYIHLQEVLHYLGPTVDQAL